MAAEALDEKEDCGFQCIFSRNFVSHFYHNYSLRANRSAALAHAQLFEYIMRLIWLNCQIKLSPLLRSRLQPVEKSQEVSLFYAVRPYPN